MPAKYIINKQPTPRSFIFPPKFAYLIGSDPKKAKRRIYSILIMLNISPHLYLLDNDAKCSRVSGELHERPPSHQKNRSSRRQTTTGYLLPQSITFNTQNLKSDYAKLQYRIKLEFPLNYPEKPPIVKFVGSINHPNICSKTG